MTRVAMLSLHTSPLGRLGVGDGGGMNVYVRELSVALARSGVEVEIYTISDGNGAGTVEVVPRLRVHQLDVRAHGLDKDGLAAVTEHFADEVAADLAAGPGVDLIHAHYWLSGMSGHQLKHRLGIPLVSTFHTLGLVKQQAGITTDPAARTAGEMQVIHCSDAVITSSVIEEMELADLYGAPKERVHVVTPGVDHEHFVPGDPRVARATLGFDADQPVVLYVGRIQPVKGLDRAVDIIQALAATHPNARLVVIGGPSGPEGEQTLADAQRRIRDSRLPITFVGPKDRAVLPTYYQAADVCLVPSVSESFGLVALEAAACGTPVVASAVGGLQFVVEHDQTGFLVPQTDVAGFADRIRALLDSPALAERIGRRARSRAETLTWARSARQTAKVYAHLQAMAPALCLAR